MEIKLSDHFTYKKLLRFAFPSIIMMVFTSIYDVVDGFFISNFVGKTSFAAVNFIMPFLIMLGAGGFMFGTGGSALIGKLMGEGKKDSANSLFSMLVYTTVLSGIAIAVIGEILLRPITAALGADESMTEDCVSYGRIMLGGLPLLMLQYEFQSFFVAAEKPKLGLYVTLAAGIMNMILDLLMVGVWQMGVSGAAAATVISQIIGGIVPVIYFAGKNTSLLRLGKTGFDGRSLAKVMGNGSSEFVSSISMSVVSMLYNGQLMKYSGEDGVAAYGVLMYVCMIFMSVFIGYSVGTAPAASFHYGAGNTRELKNLLGKSLRIVLVFAVLMFIAGEVMAEPLARVYVGYDDGLTALTLRGFRIFSFCFLFCAIPIYGSSFFTALNDGLTSAAVSFLRTVVFQVVSVLTLPLVFGIDGIWVSLAAAELMAAAVTIFFLITKRKKYGY